MENDTVEGSKQKIDLSIAADKNEFDNNLGFHDQLSVKNIFQRTTSQTEKKNLQCFLHLNVSHFPI